MNDEPPDTSTKTDFTRRGFVVTTLAAGFAVAIQPISASTITTDSAGLVAGEVKIPVKDGEMPAYRAMPAEGGPFPVVLVVEEIFGVHEHIKDICRRFAKLGYMAIAPELFARHGDVSKIKEIREIVSHVVSKVADAEAMSDLDSTARWAHETGKGDTDKLCITGFCWGGRIVWLYAAHNPDLKAAVAWYGPLAGKTDELHPKTVIELAPQLKAPVLGLYGGADTHITAEHIEKMREALKAANKPGEIIVYPGAPHGFNADYRPSYHKQAAEDGWKRLQAWFKKYGAAPSA